MSFARWSWQRIVWRPTCAVTPHRALLLSGQTNVPRDAHGTLRPSTCRRRATVCVPYSTARRGRREKGMAHVATKAPLLSNMHNLGTTDINLFSGICFSAYFTIQIILITIHIGIQYIVFQSCPNCARDCSITDNN